MVLGNIQQVSKSLNTLILRSTYLSVCNRIIIYIYVPTLHDTGMFPILVNHD